MNKINTTRGHGLLENFLSRQRTRLANKYILDKYRNGRILDIGCGAYPYFLSNITFNDKYGLDKIINKSHQFEHQNQLINLMNFDIEKTSTIPFNDNHFDVVAMLAVIEHVEREKSVKILKNVRNVLKDGGMLILTTPASWTNSILQFMAKLKLVSTIEINEHKSHYTCKRVRSLLKEAQFDERQIKCGHFEMGLNIWATAIK